MAGSEDPNEAVGIGRYFASRPVPFKDDATAREFLGDDAIPDAGVADFQLADDGLIPRFDAAVMQRTIEAVHEPRWDEWEELQVPTLAILAKHRMRTDADKCELIWRRSGTGRGDLAGGSHDAHHDAFDQWVETLRY